MNVRNSLKKEEDSVPNETLEEESQTSLGKKMKLPPILVTPKTRKKMTFPSWIK